MALPAQPSSLIRFGVFELNAVKGELHKAGISVKMHPQPFRVLLLLAERAGQAVTRGGNAGSASLRLSLHRARKCRQACCI